MSRLEELIQELCPDGVEYKELGDIFNTRNGYTPSKKEKSYWENGTIPWFRMEDIRENGRILNSAIQSVSHTAIKGKLFPANSIIVATSATIGEHALITVDSLANQRFTYLTVKPDYSNRFDIKFLYYYCFNLDKFCMENLNQGNFASVDMKKFYHFKFPIPPLPVQEEIVRILDAFTERTAALTAELTAELDARKKQYEYYLESIIAHASKSQTVKLSEICQVYDGTHKTPEYTNSGVSFISVENIDDISHSQKYISEDAFRKYKIKPQIGDIFMTRITAGIIGKCAVVKSNDPLAYYVSLALLRPNQEKVNSFYLKYYIESGLGKKELRRYTLTDATPPKINKDAIGKLSIYLPPLAEQERIVSILDRFDTLCHDLTSGLPAEIEARKKQYEYYRDKLLTFKEKH